MPGVGARNLSAGSFELTVSHTLLPELTTAITREWCLCCRTEHSILRHKTQERVALEARVLARNATKDLRRDP
jgi:hypothetical protein